MKRIWTVTAAGLSIVFLFGCRAQERTESAPQTETEKIQIIGQLETQAPTQAPTPVSTEAPTPEPIPTVKPTEVPTQKPTEAPTQKPTEAPTPEPTEAPTQKPTEDPEQGSKSEVSAEPTPVRTKAEEFCELAKTFLDAPYHRGGTSPDSGFDPGGFVYYCLNQVGVKVKHKTSKGYSENEQWTRIDSMDDLEPGDLCFFVTPGNESVNCVTVYLGNGQMIYPSSGEGKVITSKINSNYWVNAFVFARRVF
jgi:cell wall-associated NlpC family hydrolase